MTEIIDFFMENGLVAELSISLILFTRRLERKDYYWIRFFLSTAVLLVISVFWTRFLPPSAIWKCMRYGSLFLGCHCTVRICNSVNVKATLAYVSSACLVQHLIFKLSVIAEFSSYMIFGENSWPGTVVYLIAEAGFYVIFYVGFISKRDWVEMEYYPDGFDAYPYVGMMLSVNILHNLFEKFNEGIRWELYTVFNLFDITFCFFILMLQYEILKRKRAEQESLLIKHMTYLQKVQMQTSKEIIDLLNVKCHDIKKQISMLGSCIPQEEIDELNHALNIYDTFVYTGNEALDIVLAEKALLCEKQEICFDYVADGEGLMFMKQGDIYSLFGNALDNAIEAVIKEEVPERRYIGFRVYRKNDRMVVIHFENYYAATLDYEEGLPRTTKKDKYYHGFGMKSIQMIVNKYGGTLNVCTKNEMFMLNIILPIISRCAG